ncbi:Intraflagellar transport protein 56 [Taenia solium]|eukprot:TsM_000492900 transcript=TsM_000492900 gene=TsM_000492900
MILSRKKPFAQSSDKIISDDLKRWKEVPKLEEFLNARDFVGAVTLLEFERHTEKPRKDVDLWIAYCCFHLGDYKHAADEYKRLLSDNTLAPTIRTYLACCYFFMGMYKEAQEEANRATQCRLQNRLLFHIAHKMNDERDLLTHHNRLCETLEDQLSLASIHCLRNHHQEAIDIYKRIMMENRDYLALNVYLGLCYYKIDYYDVAQEVLALYLQHYPDSPTAINLRACINYRLYNGKIAASDLRSLQESSSPCLSYAKDLINHNLVVFRNGEGALQVLPSLLDVLPEARLNLIIHHLRHEDIDSAYELVSDMDPTTPQEYVLKAIVSAVIGQETASREHLKLAQQHFQLVGGSASECDTISGRQCMASCFFLLHQFDSAIIYLNSIQSYFYNDDTFNFNYGQAKAAVGAYKEAQELFLLIQSEKLRNDYVYLSWLARCYIMNKKPRSAWELYLKMETSAESFSLLHLIANDCYRMAQFYYAAKAFDVLERLDLNPEYWEGKKGACVGVFQLIIDGQESKETLREILQILRNTNNAQTDYFIRIMKKWANEHSVSV